MKHLIKYLFTAGIFSMLIIANPLRSYSQITDADISGLNYVLEEEKLAYDFYSEMYKKYNKKVFENIMNNEKVHMEMVQKLMNDLNIEISSSMQNSGEFSDRTIQVLFNDFITAGNYSFSDALRAAAMIEETDISDVRTQYSKAGDERVKALYDCLDISSQNHLRSLVKSLVKEDINYTPKVLSREVYNSIISSEDKPSDCFK